jgi:hypothetical protein
MNERRTFDTPTRARWNAPIHNILKAIDYHTELFLSHRDPWHLEKANELRHYLHELKAYIHLQEELLQENHSTNTPNRTQTCTPFGSAF